MLTRDKKNIIARTFVVWRIGDPLAFTQAIGAEGGAEGKLDGLLTNAAIGTLGGHDLSALVSTNPADLQVDQIESELLASTAPVALRNYGVTIEQIRLERIALPEENVTAVFDQMRAERRQFAAQVRGRRRARSQPDPFRGGAGSGPIRAKGSGRRSAHSRRIGGAGREGLRGRAPHRPGALPVHALAGVPRQAGHRQHDADSAHRLRAVLSAAEQGTAMRKTGPPSEIGRLAAPVAGLLDGAWQRMHWWIGAMALLYLLSGITVVRSDEVAVILRWGSWSGLRRLYRSTVRACSSPSRGRWTRSCGCR